LKLPIGKGIKERSAGQSSGVLLSFGLRVWSRRLY